MGGVDLLDSLIDLYPKKIDQRNGIIASYSTSKTIITVQTWLLYRSDSRGTGVPAKEQMTIAECLSIQTAKTRSKKTKKNKC